MPEEYKRDKWFYKGVGDLEEEIEKAGLKDKLKHFNDILTGHEAPIGYGDPVLIDVVIDGRKCDVYHTDKKPTDSFHRIFIHIKEQKGA